MNKSSAATNACRAGDASLDVRAITPAIDAEIDGVRLSGELPAKTVTAIRELAQSLLPRPPPPRSRSSSSTGVMIL
jgi:hypothetical protein